MQSLTVFILVLFTAAGPATSTTSVDDPADCPTMIQKVSDVIGKSIPGPENEPTLILDAQGMCKTFTQQRQAKN